MSYAFLRFASDEADCTPKELMMTYRENLFRLLGDRDPLQVLAQTASTLADTVRKHSATVLRTRPFEGKWTANEVIGHLTDGEWVYGYRLRLILCEDSPAILGMNQDLWVTGQRHNEREPSDRGNVPDDAPAQSCSVEETVAGGLEAHRRPQ